MPEEEKNQPFTTFRAPIISSEIAVLFVLDCLIAATIDQICRKIFELGDGKTGFAPMTIRETLRSLEWGGFVSREPRPHSWSRQSYRITLKGRLQCAAYRHILSRLFGLQETVEHAATDAGRA